MAEPRPANPGVLMANPLYDTLFAPLAARRTVLMQLPDGRETTGAAFHDRIAQAARGLQAAGVRPGDRVAVQIAKSPEALAIYAATVSIGAVFLPLNTAYTPEEIGAALLEDDGGMEGDDGGDGGDDGGGEGMGGGGSGGGAGGGGGGGGGGGSGGGRGGSGSSGGGGGDPLGRGGGGRGFYAGKGEVEDEDEWEDEVGELTFPNY